MCSTFSALKDVRKYAGEGTGLGNRKGLRNKKSTTRHKSTTNKAVAWRVPLLGATFLVLTFLPVAVCSTGSSTHSTHQWTHNNSQSSRFVRSPAAVAVVERDSIDKFSRDVATVLHVLKSSEYGSDPNIPGMRMDPGCLRFHCFLTRTP